MYMEQTADEPSAGGRTKAPIYTYHCLCKQLILASTRPLTSLPVRASTIEKPYILSLPDQLPSNEDSDLDDDASDGDQHLAESNTKEVHRKHRVRHPALLFRTVVSPTAQILRRSAGFEKRYLRYCARCKIPIGYHLDWSMFPDEEGELITELDGQQWKKTGRRVDYIYLFPGGMIDTNTMDNACEGGTAVGILQTNDISEE